ncbi:MAG: hypothetical protein ABI890_04320, partial [Lapillicoccus sp.]
MKRPLAYAAAILVSAVPAVIGLWGNASFSQAVPVRVPASAQLATTGTGTPSPSSSGTPSTSPTDLPGTDDHGGDRPAGTRSPEPGDDHGGSPGSATGPATTPDGH